ncbi:MAG: hypothetical protein JOZ69_17880, partial [Myxococcales bacterium]|nr:hypothetical protein [Myxococcales bacterium]
MSRCWALVGAAALLAWPATTRAQEADAAARADALFNAAKQLRAAGQYVGACATWAESKRLAPGVGVSLYLGDCYEHIGRPDSAWREFRDAEKLARERNDPRAEVAHKRALALEPKLSGLTLAVPSTAGAEAPEILLDGVRIPPEAWNTPLAVDPGDHVLTINVHGAPTRTIHAHIEPGQRAATIPIPLGVAGATLGAGAAGAPSAATAVATSATGLTAPGASGPEAPVPAAQTTAVPASTPDGASAPPPPGGASPRAIVGLTLLGVGAAGVGLGTAFLVKYESSVSPAPSCTPPPKDTASEIASGVFYGLGGAALAASLIVLLSDPHRATSTGGLRFAPVALEAGAGAL